MQWSDVTARPSPKTLRQFSGLCLVLFTGLAAWRGWHGLADTRTETLAAAGLLIGALGLARPAAVRWIYAGWMFVAFPIGWTVSRLMVAALFFLVFTPVALVFRLIGRDALGLGRRKTASYWTAKSRPEGFLDYFRQS